MVKMTVLAVLVLQNVLVRQLKKQWFNASWSQSLLISSENTTEVIFGQHPALSAAPDHRKHYSHSIGDFHQNKSTGCP